MVSYSAAGHLLLAAAVMVIPGLLPRPAPPRWDSVMLGSLVELPAGGGPPAPVEPAPAPAEAAAPDPQPAPPAEAAPPPPPPPVKTKAPAKPEPAKPKPQAKPTAKPAAKPEPPRPAAASPGATGSGGDTRPGATGPGGGTGAGASPSGGGAGIGLSIGGGSFGHSYYAGLVRNKLQASYQPPIHPAGGEGTLAVRVNFRLDRQGRVSDVAVDIPSPYPALDSAALRAVFRASPFPPLPPAYTGDTVDLAVTFTLEPVSL